VSDKHEAAKDVAETAKDVAETAMGMVTLMGLPEWLLLVGPRRTPNVLRSGVADGAKGSRPGCSLRGDPQLRRAWLPNKELLQSAEAGR
jgi:hypothetical protein